MRVEQSQFEQFTPTQNNYYSKGPDFFSQNLQLVQFRRNFDPSLMWRCVSNNDDGLGVSVIKIN